MKPRLVVLVSGGGTNLQAVIDACESGDLDAEVVAVVSNSSEAYGLDRARAAGIAAVAVPVDGRSRAVYDGVLAHVVAEYEPTMVVLAGWMRLLSTAFLGRFDVVNIHPAAPGTFPGLHAIERAFEAWQNDEITESGVMVHWVPDEGVDDGPVILQCVVPFEPGDTLDSFEDRVHRAEHPLLVEAIGLALGRLHQLAGPTSTP